MYMLYACKCTYIYNVHVYTCSYTGETLSYYIRTLYNQTMRSQGMTIIEHRLLRNHYIHVHYTVYNIHVHYTVYNTHVHYTVYNTHVHYTVYNNMYICICIVKCIFKQRFEY